MPRHVKISDSTYARLKALSERSGIPMARLVSDWVKKNESHKKEVKSTSEEKEDTVICDACEEEVSEEASFCPWCGVEFKEEEPEEEEEESED